MKVIFAAGGTGGHLFPAQNLAKELLAKESDLEIVFVASGLEKNRHFDKSQFLYEEIESKTPFVKGIGKKIGAAFSLLKGVMQSLRILSSHRPVLVMGFGSFHTFPLLLAAKLKGIPLILFESNAIPGKVVRLFSSYALFTAVHLPGALKHLKGKGVEVQIPLPDHFQKSLYSKEEARALLGLDSNKFTLLIFGGSQGAASLNQELPGVIKNLIKQGWELQLIHLTGTQESASLSEAFCSQFKIPCYVRHFEKNMQNLYLSADLCVCRSGALTVAELIAHALPAIFIPYPFDADRHQYKNALFVQDQIEGGVHLSQSEMTADSLSAMIQKVHGAPTLKMREALMKYKQERAQLDLSTLIFERLKNEK